MRAQLAVLLMLSSLLVAGCAGAKGCPEEYGPEWAGQMEMVRDEAEKAGVTLDDSDGDCMFDVIEIQAGTDPEDYDSHPSLEDIGAITTSPPPPPEPETQYVWVEATFDGTFQSAPGLASGSTGAYPAFEVPEGATEVFFNMTVTGTVPGNEFQLSYHDPDNQALTDPEQAGATTSGGEASVSLEEPMAGDWRVAFFSTTTPDQATFVLTVASRVPADGMVAPQA